MLNHTWRDQLYFNCRVTVLSRGTSVKFNFINGASTDVCGIVGYTSTLNSPRSHHIIVFYYYYYFYKLRVKYKAGMDIRHKMNRVCTELKCWNVTEMC